MGARAGRDTGLFSRAHWASQWAGALAALLAAAFALWLYGWRVVNPASAAWLLHGDPAQHYLGSVFFLGEPWHWPPGLTASFGASATSVVFTDSIALLALPAKLAQWPATLQYFGLWMVACHALAAWFGWRLLQRLDAPPGAALIGALFFALAPALLLRAYGHESLMGQFLVLAAIGLALGPWRWGAWLLLALVATLVHPYLAAMVVAMALACALAALWQRSARLGLLAAQAAVSVLLLWLVAWAAGYFVGSGQVSAAGHGYFSANMLTWIDPMDWAAFNRHYGVQAPYAGEWSRWLPAQRQATAGQYEGFAYLGAGVLCVLALALVRVLTGAPRSSSGWRAPGVTPYSKGTRARWVFLILACAGMAVLAVSAHPSVGAFTLVQADLPAAAQRVLGLFRASGRFIWPLTYLLMAWALAQVAHWRWGVWCLCLALVLQGLDLSGKLLELRTRFRQGPPGIDRPVTDPLWRTALRRCPALEVISSQTPARQWEAPALAAASAGARYLPAPTARPSPQEQAARQAAVRTMVQSHSWRRDTVYLLAQPLPQDATTEGIIKGLPPHMSHRQADGRDLVLAKDCLHD